MKFYLEFAKKHRDSANAEKDPTWFGETKAGKKGTLLNLFFFSSWGGTLKGDWEHVRLLTERLRVLLVVGS